MIIVTGGSGGHVIPSLAIYDHLKNDFKISLITDIRGSRFITKNKYNFELIDVPNIFSNFYLLPLNIIKFFISILKSYKYLKQEKIDFIISTGGYMSIPICLASRLLNIKIFLFEPNSVLGRANKFMLKISKKIICYYPSLKLFPKKFDEKIYPINPILRNKIYSYKKNNKKEFNYIKKILLVGGSQGAEFFDKILSEVIIEVSKKLKLEVHQQIFDNNSKILIEEKYNKLGIKNRLFNFDESLFENINDFDLVITRSGASVISEISFLNIPFVAIPFPKARDNHQYFNAKFYENKNCCWLIRQSEINIDSLSAKLIEVFNEKADYLEKKKNLEKISNQNTWNNVNKKLLELINEN